MKFKSYPKRKDTPSRKTRKSLRNSVFIYNYKIKSKLDRARRTARLNND